MKKLALLIAIFAATAFGAAAQKFALVDMEYVLGNVPAYEMANEQLNQISQRWQKEVEAVAKEAETMYKNYQGDMVFLTDSNGQTICFMSDFTVSSAATSTATYWSVQDPDGTKLTDQTITATAEETIQSTLGWLSGLFG